jgi:hypothetical protein
MIAREAHPFEDGVFLRMEGKERISEWAEML